MFWLNNLFLDFGDSGDMEGVGKNCLDFGPQKIFSELAYFSMSQPNFWKGL